MNKLSKEKMQQIILVWMVCLVVVALIWMFGVRSLSSKRKETSDSVEAVQSKIDDGNKKKSRKDASKKKLEVLQQELKGVEDGMASGELFAWIDSKLNDFITQNLLEVDIPSKTRGEIVDVGILPRTDPYKGVRYSVRGTAYYHDFGRFVSMFENAFPYMRLQNIELMPGGQFDNTGDPEKLTFRMDIVALQKPAEAVVSADTSKAKK